MRTTHVTALWLALLSAAACGGGGASRGTPGGGAISTGPDVPAADVVRADLTLSTSDGVELAATYVAGPPDVQRCVVLAHALGGSRADWDPVIERLAVDAHVLAYDLRGHGGSTRQGAQTLDHRTFTDAEWSGLALDLEAAREFFATMQIGTDACVYVGASLGGAAVLRFAGKYFDLAGVAWLSPGLAYKSLTVAEAAQQYTGPTMLMVSDEAAPREAAEQLEAGWRARDPQAPVTIFRATGAGHGLAMGQDDPRVVETLLAFVHQRLAALDGPAAAAEADVAAPAPAPGAN